MSISNEITRISGNVSDALTAIGAKGVTVPSGANSDDLADLIAQIPSGGSSAWTKVAETTYTVNTTNTTAQTVATWATGHSEIWTSSKLVYVRIRDTAGKRNGYHYGTDQFFFNPIPANGTSGTSTTVSGRIYTRYSDGLFTAAATSGTTGYGIYADQIYNDGSIRIRSRYSSSSSLTINGTYKVEVYLLDPAGGVLPFT